MPTEKQLANLIKPGDLTPSQRRENAIKAAKKSVESRQFKKTFKEAFLNLNDKEGIVEDLCRTALHQAKKGNIRALEFIRDTMGQKPTEKLETIGNIQIQKVFVTPEMQAEADKVINDYIAD